MPIFAPKKKRLESAESAALATMTYNIARKFTLTQPTECNIVGNKGANAIGRVTRVYLVCYVCSGDVVRNKGANVIIRVLRVYLVYCVCLGEVSSPCVDQTLGVILSGPPLDLRTL
jgi:hypothetical protein